MRDVYSVSRFWQGWDVTNRPQLECSWASQKYHFSFLTELTVVVHPLFLPIPRRWVVVFQVNPHTEKRDAKFTAKQAKEGVTLF
jgi:hypothetical protein